MRVTTTSIRRRGPNVGHFLGRRESGPRDQRSSWSSDSTRRGRSTRPSRLALLEMRARSMPRRRRDRDGDAGTLAHRRQHDGALTGFLARRRSGRARCRGPPPLRSRWSSGSPSSSRIARRARSPCPRRGTAPACRAGAPVAHQAREAVEHLPHRRSCRGLDDFGLQLDRSRETLQRHLVHFQRRAAAPRSR